MYKKFKHVFQFVIWGWSFILLISVSFGGLFRFFEKITYDSISDLNGEFAAQIDALSESTNMSICNFGMQLFYSDSVKTLMNASDITNTERVYLTRVLNTALSSSSFAENIYILNSSTKRVYSTDSSYPNQTIDDFNRTPIQTLLIQQDISLRFKPIHCNEGGNPPREYYAFIFYEVYSDDTPKPGALVVTINNDWYRKALLASAPSSDLIVIDESGAVLAASDNSLKEKYSQYYSSVKGNRKSGYLQSANGKEICMYYESPSTGHIYMRISSIEKILPRLLQFRQTVSIIIVCLTFIFLIILSVMFVFAFLPMRHMKKALNTINTLQNGMNESSTSIPAIPYKQQIQAVVLQSERANLEQIFYDMLLGKTESNASRLFKTSGSCFFGLFLVCAEHRKDIYQNVAESHPEIIVTKSSHIYACIGLFKTFEDYKTCWEKLSSTLGCRCFVGDLFLDFSELTTHYSNLSELKKLSLLLEPDECIISEQTLTSKSSVNTITSKDFTDLIVRLKSGNLESVQTKWQEILGKICNYRYDEFRYILYRTEDTICKVLNECPTNALSGKSHLLPEAPEMIDNIEQVNEKFQQAFEIICENFSEKKAVHYSELAEQIKNLVQENYHNPNLNSQSIADQVKMSNAYLGRLFKNTYGKSINEYINFCRINEALNLLSETNMPVEAIANQVGFGNIKYFYVLFKKQTLTTPAKFRSQQRL